MVELSELERNYRDKNSDTPRMFALWLGDWIDVTQEHADLWMKRDVALMHANAAIEDKREVTLDMNFKLAIFPNPMRDDGVFVAQDLPIEPYKGCYTLDGKPSYPTLPQRGYSIGHQLPHGFAAELVRRWNTASPAPFCAEAA